MSFVSTGSTAELDVVSGTGPFETGGAVAGFSPFSSVMSNGDRTTYRIDCGPTLWEEGLGTWHSAGGGTFSRDVVFASSASAALVNFPGQPCYVLMTSPISLGTVAFPGVVIGADDYPVSGSVPFSGGIAVMQASVGSAGGSFMVEVRNNGTPVVGLDAAVVNAVGPQTFFVTGAGALISSDAFIDAVVSSISGSPTDAWFTVNGVRG